jgi:thymidylate kinase
MQRVEARGERLERFETLERLRQVNAHFKAHLGNAALTGELILIDGNGSIEAVQREIARRVDAWLGS